MSRADALALIERYYAAFNADDLAGMLDCLADDVRHDVNQGETRVGKAAFEMFSTEMSRTYRERLVEMVVMASDDGARAASEFIVEGAYLATAPGLPPASGQRYRLPAAGLFAIENGRIARVTTYYNLQEWLRQVGADR